MSNAPSVERARHAETIEPPAVNASSFRQGWRIGSRLDALLAAGKIDPFVWQAAIEFRDAWARVWARGGGELGGAISGGSDIQLREIGRLDALAVLTGVETAIGRFRTALCVACVVEDLSWPEIGRRTGRSNHTAERWTIGALRALADAWATRPGAALGGSTERRNRPRRVAPL